jgi:sialic acid synthase
MTLDLNTIVSDAEPLIIAEVGQNHKGEFETAVEYIHKFAQAGAKVIKFQTRNNRKLFSKDAYNNAYSSPNSFGATYGEHREALELTSDELSELRKICKKNNVYFMSTPFDEDSLALLLELEVDMLKLASFDLGNLPLVNRIARTNKPLILSIGGGLEHHISATIDEVRKYHNNFSILHCVSEYPCPPEHLGLDNIETLKKLYPDNVIGSSDHFNGILSGPIAYMKGARVFEKHVTLNRGWSGTDQAFSLEPEGFRKFVRDIKRVPLMLPTKSKDKLGKEPVFQKLGKSLIANKKLIKGDILTIENLSGRIFKEPIVPVRESAKYIGKKLITDISAFEPITPDMVSDF